MAEIEPITPQTDMQISWGGGLIYPNDIFYRSIGASEDETVGWNFSWGDPEFWKFEDILLVHGGKVLDIGIGFGRTALPFALRGMNVVGIENDQVGLMSVRAITEAFPFLPIELREQNISNGEFGNNEYDTVLLGATLTHLSSHAEAYAVVDKAIRAVKPGGHLWIRAGGVETDMYGELYYQAKYGHNGVIMTEENTFRRPDHHGFGFGEESVIFFGQTELMQYLGQNGMVVIHSQVDASNGKMNIMYGEDWQPGQVERGGMITLIARKP